jgi:hypothetical protein
MKKSIALLATAIVGLIATSASAENAMQVCGAKYREAKAKNTLLAGQTWNQFLAQCRTTLPPAPAASPSSASLARKGPTDGASGAATATASATTAAAPARTRTVTPGMLAARDRQRRCATQWRADKAAGKVPAGQRWPQYWHECNTRLKSA